MVDGLISSSTSAMLILYLFYRKFKINFNLKYFLLLFIFGGYSAVSIGILIESLFFLYTEMWIGTTDFFILLLTMGIAVGLTEEFAKLVIILIADIIFPKLRNFYNGMTCSIIVAVGFATIENILYFLSFGTTVLLIRNISSTFAHAGCGLILGYFLNYAWEKNDAKIVEKIKLILKGLFLSSILHGFYNLLLTII